MRLLISFEKLKGKSTMILSSFEHDFVEEESATEPRDSSNKLLVGQPPNSEQGNTVWNAKVSLILKFVIYILFILYLSLC